MKIGISGGNSHTTSGSSAGSKSRRKMSEGSQDSSNTVEDISISDSNIPQNFLTMHSNNLAKARIAYLKSLKWRKDKKVDSILTTYQPNFNEILEVYPHALHRFSIDGCAVAYEILGKARPKEMKARGITSEHLTWHMLMRNEFLFQNYLPAGPCYGDERKEKRSMGRMMTVLDVKGVSVSDITTDVISFIKQSSEITDNYYPGEYDQSLCLQLESVIVL
jgi:hypothetical protein